MKQTPMIYKLTLLLCSGALLLANGCSSSRRSDATALPVTSAPSAQAFPAPITPEPARSPTPTFTATPNPPTLTPTSPPTLTPAPTEMSIPTLSKTESASAIQAYLRTNGGCRLPCFWGLIPGQSSIKETQNLLDHLNLSVFESPTHVEMVSFKVPGDSITDGDGGFSFYGQGDKLHLVWFNIDTPALAPDYELKNVLQTLGEPDNVEVLLYIRGPTGTPKVAAYSLRVQYGALQEVNRDHAKLWAQFNYSGVALKMGNSYRLCPTNLFLTKWVPKQEAAGFPHGVLVHLQSPENPLTLDDIAHLAGQRGHASYPDLEEATGVGVPEFYTRILNSEEPACFDTPIEFWPEV